MDKTTGVNVSKIRGLMAEHGETLKDLASKLNISKKALSDKLNNKTEFKVNEVQLIAAHYNVNTIIFLNY